ncbi:hypothetical protein [Pectinatus frisingensis]|uniref:hypothetical protein n=1 Tax=Pectinatus frisingensis TaxID=865 RepID=UPI0018C853CE|nr:hypothetical protein [Pectinatus frisingensis]
MSILIPVVSKGITLTEVPNKVAVYFEIGECVRNCKGCHSEHLRCKVNEKMSLYQMMQYAEAQVDKGANAIVLMGGTTNGLSDEELEELIIVMSGIAPVCLYTGTDDESFHRWLAQKLPLTWLKTGSYKAALGGLQSPTTNQRFYKVDIKYTFIHGVYVDRIQELIDMTDAFLPQKELV